MPVVLRQQRQRTLIGEAFKCAVWNRRAALDMGDDADLLVIALQRFVILAAEYTAFSLHQQFAAQRTAIGQLQFHMVILFGAGADLQRPQQVDASQRRQGR